MKKRPMDYPIFLTTILLVCFGVVMVFSSSFYYALNNPDIQDGYYYFKRQLLWAVIGLGAMLFMANFDYWKLDRYAKLILIVSISLLVAVLVIGREINGAKRWLIIGGVSVQPSETAKFGLIVLLASSLSKRRDKIKSFFQGILPYLLILGLMFGLIMLQPNMSTAGSLVLLTLVVLYVAGARMWHILGLVGAGAAAAVVLVQMADYRMERYMAFLDPWADPLDTGYQVIQSLYSLGSGGLFGMGLGQSRQKYLFLPYAETDFIFAVIGEEFGFIGATLLIILYLILIWRGIRIAITAPDLFGCLLATGIIGIIGIQTIINIAVVTSSMPPTGLPLPFISAGGSSLAFFMASIGVLLNISKYAEAS